MGFVLGIDVSTTATKAVLVDESGAVSWAYESPPLEVPGANLIFDALTSGG